MNKLNVKMNVPNILTMIRIFCTPLMVLMFLLPIPNGIGVFVALGIYIFGCFTDLLDGKIARKYNLITDFGKFMDQIADKFITTTAMILVLFAGVTYTWLSIIMLLIVVLRDILIGGIRMVAANKNFVIAADIYGKVKSFFLDISNMVLMLYVGLRAVSSSNFVGIVRYLGIAIMVVGVILSVVSCVNYTLKAIKALTSSTESTEIENAETENKVDEK
jgi:CDP-diacylglycerol--glycerol-3-phosphate 3-phosphatidyltransferase